MPKGMIFWVIMLFWIVSWVTARWGSERYPWAVHTSEFLLIVLVFILGWHAFGFIIY
jgi:hypothetical protein